MDVLQLLKDEHKRCIALIKDGSEAHKLIESLFEFHKDYLFAEVMALGPRPAKNAVLLSDVFARGVPKEVSAAQFFDMTEKLLFPLVRSAVSCEVREDFSELYYDVSCEYDRDFAFAS